jgi:spoIIIJ-associated protein
MVREFEGKSEKEAIENAIEALNLNREAFDVEVVSNEKGGLFKRGMVRIKVHLHDQNAAVSEPADEKEAEVVDFVQGMIERMGYPGTVSVGFREGNKIGVHLESEHSSILIGRKGKNLDAMQLIANVFAGKGGQDWKVVLDTENYRSRREESIIRMAMKTAEGVRRSRRSRLLEPMNPFERRLVHTALNEFDDIETKSEGEGLFKQVRILYKGSSF